MQIKQRWHLLQPQTRQKLKYVFLALILVLIVESVREFRTPGYYAYHRWMSLVVPIMLLLNHLAFQIVKRQPWQTVMGILAFGWLIFSVYVLKTHGF